jgi:archaemetzincin
MAATRAMVRSASAFTVCLQPLGAHDKALPGPISRGIAQAYGFRTRMLPLRPLPESAWYPPRSRYRAQKLLDFLRENILSSARGCDAVMALTAADVSTTKGEYADWGVIGLAYKGAGVGVVSSFRLRRSVGQQRVAERAVKASIHELGHALGLPHMAYGPDCIMNDAGGAVRTLDRARGGLCAQERTAAEAALGFALSPREPLDWNEILR